MCEQQPYHRAGFAEAVLQEQGINRLRFNQAEILLGIGARMIDETGREPLGGGRFVLVAQVTRALHTYEAVLVSCRVGRGVQASMLNRSLFEDVLDIHWVAVNADTAPEVADQHDRFMALAEHDLNSRFGRTDRALTEDERSEFDHLIELYGGPRRAFKAPWTRTGFEERFSLMRERWGDNREVEGYLDFIYEVIQRQNNLLLHSSPTGFRQTLGGPPDQPPRLNRAGPDSRWREALMHGAGGIYLAGRVLAEEFELDIDPMAESFSLATDLLKAVDQLDGIYELEGDAACPCGSARSVETCHLS